MHHPNCHVISCGDDAFISDVMMNEDFVELFVAYGWRMVDGNIKVLINLC